MCAVLKDTRLASLRSSEYPPARLSPECGASQHEQEKVEITKHIRYMYKGADVLLLGGAANKKNLKSV